MATRLLTAAWGAADSAGRGRSVPVPTPLPDGRTTRQSSTSSSPTRPRTGSRRLVLVAGPAWTSAGSPHVLFSLATPHRYHRPGHYQRIAARIYCGAARRDPGSLPLALGAESAGRPSLRGYLGQIDAISRSSRCPGCGPLRQQTPRVRATTPSCR